jgi:hypothetical protein
MMIVTLLSLKYWKLAAFALTNYGTTCPSRLSSEQGFTAANVILKLACSIGATEFATYVIGKRRMVVMDR